MRTEPGQAEPPARNSDDVSRVLRWVAECEDVAPVPEEWVPGASDEQRRQLAALGGAVAGYRKRVGRHAAWMNDIPEVHQWLSMQPAPPDQILDDVFEIAEAGPEAVAQLYAAIVDPSARRHLGTFFTPTAEAAWMVRRWDELFGAPDHVVDVGAGVGIFTFHAHAAWQNAGLVPIDVNPVTLGLIALQPISIGPNFERHASPELGDFARWSQEGLEDLTGRRLILGNPPYTRLQLIPRADRHRLLRLAGGLCGARASLSALILGTALRLLHAEDGVCLLLPAQWLESDYAQELRKWLWHSHNRLVELSLFDAGLFPDAQVDAVCLIVGPRQPEPQAFTLVTTLGSGRTRVMDRSRTVPMNWRALFTENEPKSSRASSATPLREYAEIRRGVATGCNKFFTAAQRDVTAWSLPKSILHPYVQRTRTFASSDRVEAAFLEALPDTAKRFILTISRNAERLPGVSEYLAYGQNLEAHSTHLSRARATWFDLGEELMIPDVIFAAAARTRFAILENGAGAAITNNLYGLTWRAETSRHVRKRILTWLRSDDGQAVLWDGSRTHAGGLRKLEVRAVGDTLVPSATRADPQDALATLSAWQATQNGE